MDIVFLIMVVLATLTFIVAVSRRENNTTRIDLRHEGLSEVDTYCLLRGSLHLFKAFESAPGGASVHKQQTATKTLLSQDWITSVSS